MNSETPRHVVRLEPGVEMAFRRIPPGTFRMGSRGYYFDEEPVHEVRIVEGFWLGETPVTQAQFALWTAAEEVEHTNEFAGNPNHPADNLSWHEANRFCDWLTRTCAGQLPGDASFACLPTEAEWENACRGGTETEYYSGDGEAALGVVSWFDGNSGSKTHPVASRVKDHVVPQDELQVDGELVGRKGTLQNVQPFRLQGVHGNVSAWCHDEWDEAAYRGRLDGAVDPGQAQRKQEWETGLPALLATSQLRVLRGGSWYDTAWYCRSASRDWGGAGGRNGNRGFRVCLVRGLKAGRVAPTSMEAEAWPGPGDGGRGTRPELDGSSVAEVGESTPRKNSRIPLKPRPPARKTARRDTGSFNTRSQLDAHEDRT